MGGVGGKVNTFFLVHDLATMLASVSKQSLSFLWKCCEMNMK